MYIPPSGLRDSGVDGYKPMKCWLKVSWGTVWSDAGRTTVLSSSSYITRTKTTSEDVGQTDYRTVLAG